MFVGFRCDRGRSGVSGFGRQPTMTAAVVQRMARSLLTETTAGHAGRASVCSGVVGYDGRWVTFDVRGVSDGSDRCSVRLAGSRGTSVAVVGLGRSQRRCRPVAGRGHGRSAGESHRGAPDRTCQRRRKTREGVPLTGRQPVQADLVDLFEPSRV